VTGGDDLEWTNRSILKQLVTKQNELEKEFSLATYFGGLRINKLEEANKVK
jgi:hypothetical protein